MGANSLARGAAPERPVVAHLKRTFLAPTETFVGNQIVTLGRYRPVVFCHHRVPNATYAVPEVYAVRELLSPPARWADDLSYRLARYLPATAARLLARRIEREGARLLHFHYLVDARYFLRLKRMTGLPAVVSAYGYDVSAFPRMYAGYGRRYLQPVFDELDGFVAMSEDMRRDLIGLGCPERKVVVHYHGIDTDRFAFPERAYPEREVVEVLCCGTLQTKKAQDRVLRALHRWSRRTRGALGFRVTFVGDGPLRGELEALVRAYGWQDRVSFLGHVPHHSERLLDAYRRADVFALPSITVGGDKEGIPGAIVEAMAAGLPVVSTYHAGIPEMIADGEDGLLVEEEDLAGLGEALGRLIADRGLRERLGRAAARTAAARGRLRSKTPLLERIYDQLAGGEALCAASAVSGT